MHANKQQTIVPMSSSLSTNNHITYTPTRTTTTINSPDNTPHQLSYDQLINENKSLQQQLEEQKRLNGVLQSQLSHAVSSAERNKKIISELKQTCELLGGNITLDATAKKDIDWLKHALIVIKNPLSSEEQSIASMLAMSDEEFEKSLKCVKNIKCFRYAMRKKEMGKEGQILFRSIKGRDPVNNELKTFNREVRVGEFLIKLTVAYNTDATGGDLSGILRSNTIPLKTLPELELYEDWISLKYCASSTERHVTQTFYNVPGVPFAIAKILSSMKSESIYDSDSPSDREAEETNRPNKKTKCK